MKFISYLVLIGLFFCLPSQGAIRHGFQGGLTLGNVKVTPSGNTENRSSFNAGVIFDYEVNNAFSVVFEPMYAEKGFRLAAGSAVTPFAQNRFNGPGSMRLNYIHIPLTMKFMVMSAYLAPFFFFGPYLGVNVTGEFVPDAGGSVKPNVKTLDAGIDLGGGISLKMASTIWFFLAVRYSLGIMDIADSALVDLKNRVWMFQAGFLFF